MTEKLTAWNERRLFRLFDRYSRLYWRGRLPRYRIVGGPCPELPEALGVQDRRRRTIWINVQAHTSDREVRSTVLHEMAHAATKSGWHDIRFFAQVEKLLQRGAPIGVGAPEAGRAQILKDIVPARFPLLKRRMERAEAQRSRELERWVERKKIPSVDLTDDGIIREFEDAASEGLSWKKALQAIGRMYGLTDESGRPTHRLARCLVAKARKAHARARRGTQVKRPETPCVVCAGKVWPIAR